CLTTKYVIRDQWPLYAGNIALEARCSFEDIIQLLNERVFFWPGWHTGPIGYGRRHFERYENESPAILRVPTEKLYAANSDASPQYCRYNSGLPRCSNGLGRPRGTST